MRESLKEVDESVKLLLPSIATQRHRLGNRKRVKLGLPPEPLVLFRGDRILLADSRETVLAQLPEDRIIIFGPPGTRDFVHLVKHIHIDGTFSIRPSIRRRTQPARRRELPDTLDEALVEQETEEEDEGGGRRPRFSQVYVVMAILQNEDGTRRFATPLLHALLTRKDDDTYERLWRMIKGVISISPSITAVTNCL